ncbi:MAG: LCP family protein [Lachnospiraceae bacterium]
MSKKEKDIDVILKDSTKKLREEMEIYSYDDDDYDERRRNAAIKKKKAKKKTRIKIAVLVTEIIVIIGLVFSLVMLVMPNSKAWLASTWIGKAFIKTAFSEESYNKIVDSDYDRNNTGINEDLDTNLLDQYLNIALFGVDSRYGELESGVQSDCIIIVSINKDTKEVRMASVYRDTYVRCFNGDGDAYFGKINSAYNTGGAAAAVKTLNANFDLNIQDYVAINFDGIADIIDLMDGIDVTITEDEAEYVNGYINSYFNEIGNRKEMYKHDIPVAAGTHHLTGIQATAYCRIRAVPIYLEDGTSLNNDFGRTARQRLIINKMVEKAKTMGIDAVLELAEQVFEEEDGTFITSIPYDDVIDLIPIVLEFSMAESKGYPEKYQSYNDRIYGDSLLPDNLAQTVVDLHKQLFNVDTYTPSKSVLGINEALCSLGGLDEDYEK